MLNFKTKEEAQKAAASNITKKDWESDSLTVTKAYAPLHGVDGWILLDHWNQAV